jgi:hypothetical protein
VTGGLNEDALRLVRAAKLAAMDKDQRAAYLRAAGWRCINNRKQQRWQSASGIVATLAGAVQLQALAELEESTEA